MYAGLSHVWLRAVIPGNFSFPPIHNFPLHSQAIRDIEWEVSEIIRTRTNQEQNITLEMPYYDIVRIKV